MSKEKISITIDNSLLKEIDSFIDGINIRNKSQAIEFLIRKSISDKRTAVILAGGPEIKLKINNTLKPLAKINGKSIIESIVANLKKYNFSEVFIVGRKYVLSEIFKVVGDGSEFDVNIKYIEESNFKSSTKSDTAKTLSFLRDKIKKTFLCTYCDIDFEYNLNIIWNFHIKNSATATLVLKTEDTPKKWGNVVLDGNKIMNFSEKPKTSDSYIVNSGIFIASPDIFKFKKNSLEYEVFPELAKKGLLNGFIASGRSRHIHKH